MDEFLTKEQFYEILYKEYEYRYGKIEFIETNNFEWFIAYKDIQTIVTPRSSLYNIIGLSNFIYEYDHIRIEILTIDKLERGEIYAKN